MLLRFLSQMLSLLELNLKINNMFKKVFFIAYIILFADLAYSQKMPVPAVIDQLYPSSGVKITGYTGGRLDISYKNRILAQDVDRLISPFRNRTETSCWQSEFWGKWFTSAVLAYRYRPEPSLKSVLDKAVDGLIATQTPDGYIGNYAENKHLEGWDIWGRKYCMLGLLAYYDLTKEQKALTAAGKEADFLMKELTDKNIFIVKKGAHRGMAASSVLEPVCQLYNRTGNKKYLDFAEEIVRQWETPDGPQLISKSDIDVSKRFPKPTNWFSWDQGQKAYEMMSCYEGLLELYRITGKTEYKYAVEKTWQNILINEINVAGSGSAVECWFEGKKFQTMHVDHYQETCVTATWIKLSQQLLRLTGEAKYADAIEQAWYNALLGAMHTDGSDWAKYSPLSGQRLEGDEQCGMGINCCVASGPRGLFTLPLTSVMGEKGGISINFFAAGNFKLQIPGGQAVEIVQETDYPVSGDINVKLLIPKEDQLTIRVRIPNWSKNSTLSINGQSVDKVVPGEFAEINRKWKSGDVIKLSLDMRGRIVKIGDHPENIAIVRGPIVLTRDARLGAPNVDETIKPVTDKEGFINLEPAGLNQEGIWMKYKASFVVESHKEGGSKPVPITFCDFASAGNTLDDHSWFRVWLPQSIDPRRLE